jgi:AcrR family transcriptional regulator
MGGTVRERPIDGPEQVEVPPGAAAVVLEDTRQRILDAGLEVLRSVGHGQFSVQKVARVAGVYQGNITYYWPRRRDLVLALAVRIVEDYLRTFERRFSAFDDATGDWAETLVCWLVEDAVSVDRVRLLPELWSMANADPEVAKEVSRAFDEIIDSVLGLLGFTAGSPGGEVLRRALALAGLAAQGLTAIHGHRAADDPRLLQLRADLCALHVPALVEARRLAMTLGDG